MVDFGGTYDASNGETMETRDALPAGEYIASIVKSERKDAKTAGNAYVNVEFEVMEGQAAGRRFWTMLNLWNSNQQAVEIAQRELNSICHAVGKLRVSSSEELHGIPMRVTLGQKTDSYGTKNTVKGYAPMNGAGGQSQQQQQSSGGSSAPWGRRSA
ncbi:MAG: DUF669 domain-containing protein [Fuscovulum sp.]|nr:MAG: DUF669 domain-containing protein [Fuscovulum sp.]